jgi:hypothetical protein
MRVRQLLPIPSWNVHVTPTAILLGHLAHHYGRSDLVAEYLAVAPEDWVEAKEMPYFEDLRRRVA